MNKRFMRIVMTILIVGLVAAGTAFAGGQQDAGDGGQAAPKEVKSVELSYAHIFETSHPYHKWAEYAAEKIAEETEGRYTVKVYPASTLGKESANLEGLALGTVDIMPLGLTHAGDVYGDITAGIAPFVFRDFAHWEAYASSDVFNDLVGEFEMRTGHKVLGTTYYGARHVTSNFAVNKPSDMKNLKIRVPSGELMLIFPRAVGANPTPMAFAEVYLALQQGTVDAQENPLPTIKAKKFHEVQKFINLTGHIFDSHLFVVSRSVWSNMSDQDKKIFEKVYGETAVKCSNDIRNAEKEDRGWFENQDGVTVNEVDRGPFQDAVVEYIKANRVPFSLDFYNQIKNLK